MIQPGEGIAQVRYFSPQSPVVPACGGRDLHAIVKVVQAVLPMLGIVPAALYHQVTIAEIKLVSIANAGHAEAILVFGDYTRFIGVEPAEMEETQRLPIHGNLVAYRNYALMQIPIGDVIFGISNDLHTVEESWGHIHPALVDE